MSGWLDKYFDENITNKFGAGFLRSSAIYNFAAGEFYFHLLLGLLSAAFALINVFEYFKMYMANQATAIPFMIVINVFLGILALIAGIAGLILCVKDIPYAFRCTSIYRLSAIISGMLFSLIGILATIGLVIFAFVPRDAFESFIVNAQG